MFGDGETVRKHGEKVVTLTWRHNQLGHLTGTHFERFSKISIYDVKAKLGVMFGGIPGHGWLGDIVQYCCEESVLLEVSNVEYGRRLLASDLASLGR